MRKHDRDGQSRPSADPPPTPPSPVSDSSPNGQPAGGALRGRFQKPAVEARGRPSQAGAPGAGDAFSAYPTLVAFLAETVWSDGTPRLTGTLVLYVESHRWGCCVTQRAVPCGKAFLSAKTLQELLEDLEEGLAHDSLDWRMPTGGKRG